MAYVEYGKSNGGERMAFALLNCVKVFLTCSLVLKGI